MGSVAVITCIQLVIPQILKVLFPNSPDDNLRTNENKNAPDGKSEKETESIDLFPNAPDVNSRTNENRNAPDNKSKMEDNIYQASKL